MLSDGVEPAVGVGKATRVPRLAAQRRPCRRRVSDRLRLALLARLGAVRQADRGESGGHRTLACLVAGSWFPNEHLLLEFWSSFNHAVVQRIS